MTPDRRWDVLVVGAGPAGCAAAYDLAMAGCSVLLVDKSDFPRHKACAGGLTLKAVRALRYSIDAVVKHSPRRVRLQNGRRSDVLLASRDPICVMTVRAELDEFCLRKTLAVGAEFRKIPPIRQIVPSPQGVELLTDQESYRARFLIGADGANGQVRRLCAEGAWFSTGFALEAPAANPEQECDLTFDFAAVEQGYGWIFPKNDHVNVGIYSLASGLRRSQLLQYLEQKIGSAVKDDVTGQYLGLGAGVDGAGTVRRDLEDRVLLVGDAGGFADPLTGEGIYGAILSGQAAAASIVFALKGGAAAAEGFAGGVSAYRQTLRFSMRAAAAFYHNPARGFKVLNIPLLRRTLLKTYTHGLRVENLAARIALARC